jgi:uncharacterized protein (DUF488 family)
MIDLFTIGFTGKTAEKFFSLLQENRVRQLVDTRANTTSQLSGFAKLPDLAFFSEKIAGIGYKHEPQFAPSKELLNEYRSKKINWAEYESDYLNLLDSRKVAQKFNVAELHESCFLCSEHAPEKCHRRLLAEYLSKARNDVRIVHLK